MTIRIKSKLNWLLWILLILSVLINEISYNYASTTRNANYSVSIHSIAGYSGQLSILGGTARYVTAQEGLIDNIAMYASFVLIFVISIRSWMGRKSKAPILFPPKS